MEAWLRNPCKSKTEGFGFFPFQVMEFDSIDDNLPSAGELLGTSLTNWTYFGAGDKEVNPSMIHSRFLASSIRAPILKWNFTRQAEVTEERRGVRRKNIFSINNAPSSFGASRSPVSANFLLCCIPNFFLWFVFFL